MLKHYFSLSIWIFWIRSFVSGRNWSNILQIDQISSINNNEYLLSLLDSIIIEDDPFLEYNTKNLLPSIVPSEAPSISNIPSSIPSSIPTLYPSSMPSDFPSLLISSIPSSMPSSIPSTTPTITSKPSMVLSTEPSISQSPTNNIWETHPIPSPDDEIPIGYFNYNPNPNIPGGLNNWRSVINSLEYEYWMEFKDNLRKDLNDNRCHVQNGKHQSPIDLHPDIVNVECREYHEIRHQAGNIDISDDTLCEKQILPSKLRLKYSRRDPNNNSSFIIDPPSADIPAGWGKQLDVLHVDLKVPSEHTLNGTQYAAEWQINIIQTDGHGTGHRGAPVTSILFDIHPNDEPNIYFQLAIDEWQKVFDADLAQCELNRQSRRRLHSQWYHRRYLKLLKEESEVGFSTWADEPKSEIKKQERKLEETIQRLRKDQTKLFSTTWDPWSEEYIKLSPWFYGYWGSLTEPPCSEFVQWHIIDTPAYLSKSQIRQIKHILFNHVDRTTCMKTSNHYKGSVARPIRSNNNRDIWKCTCKDFLPDKQRKEECRKRCTQEIGGKCHKDWELGDPWTGWTTGDDDDDDIVSATIAPSAAPTPTTAITTGTTTTTATATTTIVTTTTLAPTSGPTSTTATSSSRPTSLPTLTHFPTVSDFGLP